MANAYLPFVERITEKIEKVLKKHNQQRLIKRKNEDKPRKPR